MSVINRTVFFDVINGSIVFHDWAEVNTTLGSMLEPLNLNRFNTSGIAFDPSDEASKITELREVDFGKLAAQPPFSDEGTRLHGGALNPRTGF